MEFLSKEDFGDDLSKYRGLSGIDCLAIVAAKALEKEQRGKSKVVDDDDETKELFRVRVRGFLFQELPKIEVPMQEKPEIICHQRNKEDKGVIKPPKRARNDDDYEPGPSDRAMQPKQKKPRRPQQHEYHHHNAADVVIPEDVKDKIAEMNGTELKFVIQKRITSSDLRDGQNRLSMPILQCSVNLLELIGGTDISVQVIKPTKELEVERLNFTKWSKSSSFMLNGSSPSWHDFVKSCGNLHEGDTIRVWTFRLPGGRHGFAIVKV